MRCFTRTTVILCLSLSMLSPGLAMADELCGTCNGSGYIRSFGPCSHCQDGLVSTTDAQTNVTVVEVCHWCEGDGVCEFVATCPVCEGVGSVPVDESATLDDVLESLESRWEVEDGNRDADLLLDESRYQSLSSGLTGVSHAVTLAGQNVCSALGEDYTDYETQGERDSAVLAFLSFAIGFVGMSVLGVVFVNRLRGQ